MKILLVTLNAKYIHSSLALRSLRANLPKDFDCEILELTINNHAEHILAAIYRHKPDVVGLSCYIWNTDILLEMSDELKKLLPYIKIVAGGPEAAYNADEVLRNHRVDIVVLREGEEVFAKLAQNGFDPRGIDGVAYIENGCVASRQLPQPLLPDLNRINFAYADVSGFAADGLENRIIYYESSRGCPYSCAYCLSANAGTVRKLDSDTVCAQLDSLSAMKPAQIKFTDRTFNFDKRRAEEIWRYLIENDNGVTNFHFEISGVLLDAASLALLKTARQGLFQFEIGVQSTNPRTLAAINRPEQLTLLYENVCELIKNRNIHIHLDLIAGLPYEDLRSFRNSFNDVYGLKPHMLQLGFLKLLKGSPLRADAEKYGMLCGTNAPYEVLSTKWLSFDDLLRLKRIEEALEVYYNSGQFRSTVRYLERFFETPFDFYDALARELRLGEGTNRAKKRVAYELYEFAVRLCGEKKKLLELLRFDLCLNESPRSLPDWLRDDVPVEIKKKFGVPKQRNIALERFSYTVNEWFNGGGLNEREAYILFDYEARPKFGNGVNCEFKEVKFE